jgi:signal transduction histidine kinase
MVQQIMLNLRRLIRGLRPIYLEDLGLVTALQMLVQETEQNAGLAIHFGVIGTQRRLPADQEMSLYRMVQESLANIVRHAQAARAEVILTFTGEVFHLSITDHGKGFRVPEQPSELSHHGHFGLLGMQERAELIGAELKIQSTPGQGTQVRIILPFSDPTPLEPIPAFDERRNQS